MNPAPLFFGPFSGYQSAFLVAWGPKKGPKFGGVGLAAGSAL